MSKIPMVVSDDILNANIDQLISDGLNYDGPLQKYFIAQRTTLMKEQSDAYAAKHNDQVPAGDDLKAVQAKVHDAMVQKSLAELKPALLSAAKGDTDATKSLDLNQLAGMATTYGNVANAMSSGSIMGMIMAIPQLLSDSFIGDYLKAGFNYFFGDPKPDSFSSALAQVRLDKGVEHIAKGLGANPADLAQALTIPGSRDVEINQADPASVAVTFTETRGKGADAKTTTITETGRFDKDQQTITFDKAHFHTADNRDGDLQNVPPMIVKVKPEDIDPTTGKLRIDDALKGAVLTQASGMESLIPAATPAAQGTSPAKQ